jgi:hypothetical protein
LSIHQGLPSPAQQSCCHTKRVGMKILSVVGTTQSCFHTERVGMKILSAIGTARSLAPARWGFTKAMASGPWATQAKPQLPKKILCRKTRDVTNAHVSVDQAPRLKGVDLSSIFWSIYVVALDWVVRGETVVSSHYIRVVFINERVPCLLLFLALPTKARMLRLDSF